jgi:phospholipid transport system substrate-binding protein
MRRYIKKLVFLALFAPVFVTPVLAQTAGPSRVVKGFQESLLAAIKDAKKIGVQGRFDIIAPAIDRAFHLPLMVATATSPYWRAGTASQRKELVAAFHKMSATIVATLFDGYDGETFTILRERKSGGPTVLIDTQIVRPDNSPVNITYVAARIRERWWLIDIIVEGGISEVKVRRNEYIALLKQGGLPRLTRELHTKSANLLTGNKSAKAR